jgi:hypothetical protein
MWSNYFKIRQKNSKCGRIILKFANKTYKVVELLFKSPIKFKYGRNQEAEQQVFSASYPFIPLRCRGQRNITPYLNQRELLKVENAI